MLRGVGIQVWGFKSQGWLKVSGAVGGLRSTEIRTSFSVIGVEQMTHMHSQQEYVDGPFHACPNSW